MVLSDIARKEIIKNKKYIEYDNDYQEFFKNIDQDYLVKILEFFVKEGIPFLDYMTSIPDYLF